MRGRSHSSLKEWGRVNPVGGLLVIAFVRVPGWVRTNAGEGPGSRLDRQVDPRSGRGLDAGPDRRRIVAPGTWA